MLAASPGREAASKQAAACLLDSRSYGCLAISPLMLPNGDIAVLALAELAVEEPIIIANNIQ